MKIAFHFILILFLSQSTLFAQQKDAYHYSDLITVQQLRSHLDTLASAAMEGRKTGTRGAQKAANYISQQFSAAGIPVLPEYQEQFVISKDTLVPLKLKVGSKEFKLGIDYLITTGNREENEFKTRGIVFAGYGISTSLYDDYANLDVKNKVVVIFPGEPKQGENYLISGSASLSEWGTDLSAKIKVAVEKEAAALFVVNPSEDVYMTSKAAEPQQNKPSATLPVINITRHIFSWIFDGKIASEILRKKDSAASLSQVNLNKRVNIRLRYGEIRIPAPGYNVIGIITGSLYPKEYVFITAHYDHLGIIGGQINYGADDNASGVSRMLEIARAFEQAVKDGKPPERSIIFIAFSGEELGLVGSAFYVDHPVFPLDSISVVLNIDMIGRVQEEKKERRSGNYLYVIGNDRISPDLDIILSEIKGKTLIKADYKYNDPKDPEMLFFRSDQYNFAKKGVPVLFFTNGVHADYHLPSDTVDKIEFDVLEIRAKYIFLIAWEIANRAEMLRRDWR